jgi:hypothetical protein
MANKFPRTPVILMALLFGICLVTEAQTLPAPPEPPLSKSSKPIPGRLLPEIPPSPTFVADTTAQEFDKYIRAVQRRRELERNLEMAAIIAAIAAIASIAAYFQTTRRHKRLRR